MDKTVIVSALAGLSVLTTLTVEGIKKILNSKEIKYNADVLAAVTAVVLTVIVSICYIIFNSIAVTPQVVITVIAMAFLSFLGATTGYDKLFNSILKIKK